MFFLSCNEQNYSATDSKPNIIIIYADDVGFGDKGVYGSELIPTPHIDQLAEEGIRFTSAYATSAMCTPSRFSLLTGIYAFRLPGAGILSAEVPLLIEPGSLTLPSMLQQAGYRTSIVGKWHLGLGEEVGELDWNEEMAFEFVKRSRLFINENKNNPFFLFLSMHENLVPRIPPPDFIGASETGLRGDSVVELDWVVGQIVDQLDDLDLREETMIIFTSDNGPVFYDGYEDGSLEDHNRHDPNGMYRGGKYIAFEGGTRMPTIVKWSTHIEPETVSDAIISQVDFLATFASLVDAELADDIKIDSQNHLSALLGKSEKAREHVVQQSSDGLALRKGAWKYIESSSRSDWAYDRHNRGNTPLNIESLDSSEYLFNLDEDPGETNNLAEEHPEVVQELTRLLEDIRKGNQ